MADQFFKESVINCTLLTESNAEDSIFVYQCSAETNSLRGVITVTHLLFLLMGCIMVGVIDCLGWAACCLGGRGGCCFRRVMLRLQENLLPRVPGFLAHGVSRVPDFLDSSLQWSLRTLYATVANPDTYPSPDSSPGVHVSGQWGPMRWRDAAARLVLLLLEEGAVTPGPARKRPAESIRAYLTRLDADFGDSVADAGLPSLDTPTARRPSRSVPTSAGRASSILAPVQESGADRGRGVPRLPPAPSVLARARSGLGLPSVSRGSLGGAAGESGRSWGAGPRSVRPVDASALSTDARSVGGVVLLAEAACFSESVWTSEVYQDLSIALSRFFSILNDQKRRAADAEGSASPASDGTAEGPGRTLSRRGLSRGAAPDDAGGFAMAAVFGGAPSAPRGAGPAWSSAPRVAADG